MIMRCLVSCQSAHHEHYDVLINEEQVNGGLFVVLFIRLCKDVSHTIPDLPCNQEQDLLSTTRL
ncbi:hypothetical protein EMIT091MI3_280005 [Kosakonia quasisacchari]